MSSLTNRDKILIFILVVLMAAAAIYMLFVDASRKERDKLKDSLSAAQTRWEENKGVIDEAFLTPNDAYNIYSLKGEQFDTEVQNLLTNSKFKTKNDIINGKGKAIEISENEKLVSLKSNYDLQNDLIKEFFDKSSSLSLRTLPFGGFTYFNADFGITQPEKNDVSFIVSDWSFEFLVETGDVYDPLYNLLDKIEASKISYVDSFEFDMDTNMCKFKMYLLLTPTDLSSYKNDVIKNDKGKWVLNIPKNNVKETE